MLTRKINNKYNTQMLKKAIFTEPGSKTSKKENNFAPNGIFLYHLLAYYALKRTTVTKQPV